MTGQTRDALGTFTFYIWSSFYLFALFVLVSPSRFFSGLLLDTVGRSECAGFIYNLNSVISVINVVLRKGIVCLVAIE